MKKLFFYKDKTGRGYTKKLTLADFKSWSKDFSAPILEDRDYDGERLGKWIKQCSEGETWENAQTLVTCVQEGNTLLITKF